jgi:acetyl-CoA carboxylase carboxyl transferase subunit alpha
VATLGCVDEIVREPAEGVQTSHEVGSGLLGRALQRHLAELKGMPADELVAARQEKFRNIARCYTEG